MKKIFFIIFAVILFNSGVFASGYFEMGKAAFSKQDYNLANVYFVKALTQNPNDANCRYYYAQTLTYLKNYKQARIEYTYVTQLAPNTTVGDYAQQSIKYLDGLNNQQSSGNDTANTTENSGTLITSNEQTAGNYLTQAISSDGELLTWDLNKMPIKVYIDNSYGASATYIAPIKEALYAWQSSADGLISFLFINEKQYADLTITLKGSALKTENQTLGLTTHTNKNGYIDKVSVTLYTLGPNYKRLTTTDVYNVALHEFGHALGIWGHSDKKEDALYALYSPSTAAKTQLSSRDKDTIKLLYSIDKNPYSVNVNSITNVLGDKEARMNTKIEQELAYIKQVPGNPSGYINTGNTYYSMHDYDKATEYYKKALSIDANSKDANNALGKIYAERNDLKNAEFYYKKLIQIDSKNPHSYCTLINLYIKNNKIQFAKSQLSSLLYRNPAAKNEECIQKIMQTLNSKQKKI